MKPMLPIATGAAAAAFVLAAAGFRAQPEEQKEAPKVDKEFVERLKEADKEVNAQQKIRDIQNQAIQNLREVGEALFKFHSEYGGFPGEKTAIVLKEKGIKPDPGAATANDCFQQLVATKLITDPKLLTFEKPDSPEARGGRDLRHGAGKCSFALVVLSTVSGEPLQPLAVAPLVKGKTTFDPGPLGGSAVILRRDKSVVLAPIDKNGRVMLDGKDLFDPEQSFWKGASPSIKWPKD